MGANSRVTAQSLDKLPEIGRPRGFHGIGAGLASTKAAQLNVEDVDLEFPNHPPPSRSDSRQNGRLPGLVLDGGILANQQPVSNGPLHICDPEENEGEDAETPRQGTFITALEEDEEEESQKRSGNSSVSGSVRTSSTAVAAAVVAPPPGDSRFCNLCSEKAASELGKLTEKIIELKLEADRQQVQFDATKRKLDNTSKELKTAQAMIVTLKSQNTEKANRIAKLTREATIGLWEREKRKLLQFADVREASLEIELGNLKESSERFRGRALDRIAFLHDQVYKLKLKLSLTNQAGRMTRALESAEKRLTDTQKYYKQELNGQREQFFRFKQNMVGMLAGFRKDFGYLTNQVDPKTYEANSEFFDHAEQFDSLLEDLHKAALTDKLSDKVDSIPGKFTVTEGQMGALKGRFVPPPSGQRTGSRGSSCTGPELLEREGSMSNEDVLRQLENIEQALQESGEALKDYDLNDINDSGISLNEYETHSELTRETPLSGISKSVRFEDEERIADKWRKRRSIQNNTSEKYVQTDILPEPSPRVQALQNTPPVSRKGKRNRKSKAAARADSSPTSRTPTPTTRKKAPKRVDAAARAAKEAELQRQWLDGKKTPNAQKKKKGDKTSEKSRQNTITFTHLRDLYGERKVSSLIDRITGAVDIDTAAEQFPNLSRGSIVEGFSQFVQFDGNNDYRLDIGEVIRAISRISDQVIEAEEVKAALFELGVLETDELDFFDFLCIQETLACGTFEGSKSKMLRQQGLTTGKKSTVSKYCAVM